MGDREDLGRFELEVMRMVIWHVDRYNSIGEDDIDRLAKMEESLPPPKYLVRGCHCVRIHGEPEGHCANPKSKTPRGGHSRT